ncbi:MAG: ABC transporter permease subunit [Thermoplasmata archaeon]
MSTLKHRLTLRHWKYLFYALIILFFLIFVLLPVLYSFVYVFSNWETVRWHVLTDEKLVSLFGRSILISLLVSGVVVAIDIVLALPLAWFLAKREIRGKDLIDTLVDLPLVIPTAAVGFSTTLFFAKELTVELTRTGAPALFSSPLAIVILLHISFTLPYMVRSMKAGIEEVDLTYEFAGECFGATKFTVARTITLPIMKAAIVTGIILCLARSLSETGATFLALSMVTNVDYGTLTSSSTLTGPALINSLKNAGYPYINEALGFMSMVLIALSIGLLAIVKIFAEKFHFPFRKVYSLENLLSSRKIGILRDATGILLFLFLALIPSLFILAYIPQQWGQSVHIDYGKLLSSLGVSLIVATLTTLICIATAIPLAVYIARARERKSAEILDMLANIPIIVPTVALGISLGLFWKNFFNINNNALVILVIVLAHVSFTYPFLVRTFAAAMRQIPPDYEEAAKTLGAGPFAVFRKIVYPLFKPSIIAGVIMIFTRSLDETGATIAVIPANAEITTIPVYIVNLVKAKDYYSAAIASLILLIIAIIVLLAIRITMGGRKKC